MDEIKLFGELQPPPPPDAARMREAARARLTAAASAPPAHPARRRNTVAVATAVAVAAAGTGYGLTAALGSSRSAPPAAVQRGSSPRPAAAAGLTAVHGCPGKYMTAGALKDVSGTRLVIEPAFDISHRRISKAQPVTVTTTPSTAITRPVDGTVGDITDGSLVVVQGNWSSGGKLAATNVGIEAALPPALGHRGPPVPFALKGHTVKIAPLKGFGPPFVGGTVTGLHDGSFTVIPNHPFSYGRSRVPVTTSSSTKVLTKGSTSLSQLGLGYNVVAVGTIGSHGVLTASIVAEPALTGIMVDGPPVKLHPSGCSDSAITSAILAGS